MPEPGESPTNPAPEGGDFTEALPELQAALQADSDEITETAAAAKNINKEVENANQTLKKIEELTGKTAQGTPTKEEKVEKKAKEVSRFDKLMKKLTGFKSDFTKIIDTSGGVGKTLGNLFRPFLLAVPAAILAVQLGIEKVVADVSNSILLLRTGVPQRIIKGFRSVVAGIQKSKWFTGLLKVFRRLRVGILKRINQVIKFFGRVLKPVATVLKFIRGTVSKVFRFIMGAGKRAFGFFNFIGKFFGRFGKIFKVAFRVVGKILGKIFFPIELILGVIRGVRDFFNAPPGKRGGLGGLLKSLFNGLLETFTFGLLDVNKIFGFFDELVTQIRILANLANPFSGSKDERATLRAERFDRELAGRAESLIRTMRRTDATEDEIRAAVMADREARIAEKGLDERTMKAFESIGSEDSAFNKKLESLMEALQSTNQSVAATSAAVSQQNMQGAAKEATPTPASSAPPAVDPNTGGSMGLRGALM